MQQNRAWLQKSEQMKTDSESKVHISCLWNLVLWYMLPEARMLLHIDSVMFIPFALAIHKTWRKKPLLITFASLRIDNFRFVAVNDLGSTVDTLCKWLTANFIRSISSPSTVIIVDSSCKILKEIEHFRKGNSVKIHTCHQQSLYSHNCR